MELGDCATRSAELPAADALAHPADGARERRQLRSRGCWCVRNERRRALLETGPRWRGASRFRGLQWQRPTTKQLAAERLRHGSEEAQGELWVASGGDQARGGTEAR